MCAESGIRGLMLLPRLVSPVEGRRRPGLILRPPPGGWSRGPPATWEAVSSICHGPGVCFVETRQGGVLGGWPSPGHEAGALAPSGL